MRNDPETIMTVGQLGAAHDFELSSCYTDKHMHIYTEDLGCVPNATVEEKTLQKTLCLNTLRNTDFK